VAGFDHRFFTAFLSALSASAPEDSRQSRPAPRARVEHDHAGATIQHPDSDLAEFPPVDEIRMSSSPTASMDIAGFGSS
jgi:hypothetical protein